MKKTLLLIPLLTLQPLLTTHHTSNLTSKILLNTTIFFAPHILKKINRHKRDLLQQNNLSEKKILTYILNRYERATNTRLPSDLQHVIIKYFITPWHILGYHKDTGTCFDFYDFDKQGRYKYTGEKYNTRGFDQNHYYKKPDPITKQPTKYDPQGYDIDKLNREGKNIYGVSINNKLSPATKSLHQAILTNNLQAVQRLLTNPTLDINATHNNCTPLYQAIAKENLSMIILLLLQKNININSKNGLIQDSLLHLAAKKTNKHLIVLLLLQPSIDVNIVNLHGETALHIACEYNNAYVTLSLLRHPLLNPNIKNHDGESPVHIACKIDYNQTVLLLLNDSRTQVNILDGYGDSLLHNACYQGNKPLLKHLAKHPGININVENSEKKTALDEVFKELVTPKKSHSRRLYKRIWRLLVEYGAQLKYYSYTHHDLETIPKELLV